MSHCFIKGAIISFLNNSSFSSGGAWATF
ncbi:hypothetical protein [Paenibacillus ihbetae]